MKAQVLGALLLLTAASLQAQPNHPVTWAASPVITPVQDSFKKAPAVFILDEIVSQTQAGDEDDYDQYYTTHWIIHLNDELGTEAFKTFHIPLPSGARMYEIMARTIQPGGRVLTVAREKIQKINSEQGGREYLIALEGVSPGAEVEILYTMKLPGSASGSEVFQYRLPVQKAVFRLIEPEPMIYDCKGYNGFPNPKDSLLGMQRCYSAIAYNIPALEEEQNSRYQNALQRVDFKLSYVLHTEREKVRRQSWDDMAEALWQRYADVSEKKQRIARKILEKSGLDLSGNEEQRVIAIEDFMKNKFSLAAIDDNDDWNNLIRNRQISEHDLVQLFAACFRSENIAFQIGKVNNRFDLGVDDSLEIWSRFSEYCFFLPGLNAYIAPAAPYYRYPYIPYQLCGAKGIFAKISASESDIIADPRILPQTNPEQNSINITALVRFEGNDLVPLVQIAWDFKGQSAADFIPQLVLLPKDKEQEFVSTLIGLSDKPADIDSYSLNHVTAQNFTTGSSLQVSATLKAARLMEHAGPKYLFHIGALIGQQMSLYEEKKRRLPVELDYPNEQLRTLRVAIPTGYQILSPEQLRINQTASNGSDTLCSFHSDYKIEGNELVVSVRERYLKTSIPLSAYEGYRKVVNVAADFSKLAIVLEKI